MAMGALERDCAIIEQSLRQWSLGEAPATRVNAWQTTRVITDSHARTVYSYGRHFPLAIVYPHGRNHRSGIILLNGDRWPGFNSRTGAHQTECQRAAGEIARERSGWQVIIIPLSALDGAGIDGASIRPIAVDPDTWDRFTHTAIIERDTFGAAPVRPMVDNPSAYDWRRERVENEPLRKLADDTTERRRLAITIESSGNGIARAGIPAKVTREVTVYRKTVWRDGYYGRDGWQASDHNPPRFEYSLSGAIGTTTSTSYPTSVSAKLADDGASIALDWDSSRHWLGEALFSAERVSQSSRPCHTANPLADDGEWCAQCGGSLARDGIERREVRRRYRWLSSFDYNERAPLYFLAALPTRSRARSIDMALDDLAPRAVHSALARGLAVERQGDIFLIPTALTDADIANRGARRTRFTCHSHGAKPRAGEIGYAKPLDADGRRRMAQWRRKEYRRLVSQAPHNAAPVTDRGARKRFAALRSAHTAKVASLDATLRAAIMGAERLRRPYQYGYQSDGARGLASWQVRAVIARNVKDARARLDYERNHGGTDSHGRATVAHARDWYRRHNANRALELWRQADTAARLRFEPMAVFDSGARAAWSASVRDTLAIYGTAHTATEVAVTKVGTYVRGTVRHAPALVEQWRTDADHAPLRLAPDTWYLAVRNTVPRMVGSVAPRRRGW
jgi:hypothetical protein